jgi:uncharacterized protein (DUF608 family)
MFYSIDPTQPEHASARRTFTPPNLLQIAMPMGGIGAGCICLNGYGGLQDYAVFNRPNTSALPDGHGDTIGAFALLHIKGANPITRLLEGPFPMEKIYDQALQGQGYRGGGFEGMPRFEKGTFTSGYPFGDVDISDPNVPLRVHITGWSPFIPLDDVASGMPCAILDYRFENTSAEPIDFEFSYHLSHLLPPPAQHGKPRPQRRGSVIDDGEAGGGVYYESAADPSSEQFGNAALYAIGWKPKIKARWFRGPWFDALSVLWREVSTGSFTENDGTDGRDGGRGGGSILGEASLAPGEVRTFSVAIAWYFPNPDLSVGAAPGETSGNGPSAAPTWRPFYAGQWKDAADVARYAAQRYEELRTRTEAFRDALFASTFPPEALDAIASNLAILKSPTVLRQENGNVWGWEGCFTAGGCCHGSCTHVWNYAQAMPNLFPALERTLREQELVRSMNDAGHVQFRSALPDGPTPHDHYAAADGQLGGIMKIYRDWQISGDTEWLKRLYTLARLSLDYCIATWDPDHRGGLFEPHHNTYDIEFWGPDGMCGTIYVGALAAMSEMAAALGKQGDAKRYGVLAEKAAQFMAEELFNGEYFQQNVQWTGLKDNSFSEKIQTDGDEHSEVLALLRAEGPKYQYGTGVLSDGVIGAWMAKIYGIETPLDREMVRSTLKAIHRYNFRADLSDHACTQRPGYALGHEPGLLLCSWPRGNKPTLPFVYSDEVWTGIEYQVASHLIEEGLVDEGMEIVRGVRARYEGHVRNPFNEYECGSYYARAMASYALLGALSGFRYSAVDHRLTLAPKLHAHTFRTFFCAASGFGLISVSDGGVEIEMVEGELPIEEIRVSWQDREYVIPCEAVAAPGEPVHATLHSPE